MKSKTDQHFFYSGLIRLHILHHAVKRPFYGLWMIEELGEHGYKIGPGTLYPLLHGLAEKGFLTSYEEKEGRITRKFYKATSKGKKALAEAKGKVRELLEELEE
jgi:PadR family transcriptional regulator